MARGAPPEWDRDLLRWPRASLLQSRGWAAVQGRAGWSSHLVPVETRNGVLPVLALEAPAGVPGFSRLYVPRGPACAASDLDAFAALELALGELGKRRRALALDVEAEWLEEEVPPDHPWRRWPRAPARQPLATTTVDLAPEPDLIMASFSAKTRYNVRLAERRGVEVDEAAPLADLVACVLATAARQRIHLPSPQHLQTVTRELGSQARILAARVEGEAVAAILIGSFAGRAIYLYGGASGRHRERMPNQLLHWRAMLAARSEGQRLYDLWGVPETDAPDHPWRGLAQFKLGFGGPQITYAGNRRLELRRGGATIVGMADAVRRRARRRGRR
ncbi:MAG: lipid II:glycine glycyltransferase FemX [Candidatus Dormibacteria bacterium]